VTYVNRDHVTVVNQGRPFVNGGFVENTNIVRGPDRSVTPTVSRRS
jgi:hypothetical protein